MISDVMPHPLAVLTLALSRATSYLRRALRRPWPRGARPTPYQYAKWWHAQADADQAYLDAMDLLRALAPLVHRELAWTWPDGRVTPQDDPLRAELDAQRP